MIRIKYRYKIILYKGAMNIYDQLKLNLNSDVSVAHKSSQTEIGFLCGLLSS
jgi:hypothetical protein